MFFILSKTLIYFTMPFVLVCTCFVLSVLIRKQPLKKRFFWIGFISLLFLSNGFIANEMMRWWEASPIPFSEMKRTYDVGIVLTGVTKLDIMPKDRIHFGYGAGRVVHTVQLYKDGFIKKILISGYSGRLLDEGQSEAEDIRDVMVLMGVPAEDILLENVSRNTHESAVEVKKILAARQIKPDACVLITSAFHIPRSLACYQKEGLKMDTFPTDFYARERTFTPDVLIIPRVESFTIWHILSREWVGLIAYKLVGYV